jgi:hypothetical protein
MDPNDVSYLDEDDEELLGKFRVASTARPARATGASDSDGLHVTEVSLRDTDTRELVTDKVC